MFPTDKPYHKKTVYDRVNMGVFMGEVIDFDTGLPVKVGRVKRRRDTINIIESLYQRRHQVEDIVFIATNKLNLLPIVGCSAKDIDRRILWTYLNDYMVSFSDTDFDD
jgi:hypothetical protein